MRMEPRKNTDGTWTITVLRDGKLVDQKVSLERVVDHMGWEHAVDETVDDPHNSNVANEESHELTKALQVQ